MISAIEPRAEAVTARGAGRAIPLPNFQSRSNVGASVSAGKRAQQIASMGKHPLISNENVISNDLLTR
jgi:hypothetical protein